MALPVLAGGRLLLLVGFLVVISVQPSSNFVGAPCNAVAGIFVALSFLAGGLLAHS
jgi:hypothetical protein